MNTKEGGYPGGEEGGGRMCLRQLGGKEECTQEVARDIYSFQEDANYIRRPV